jgi:hypothetical protein
LVVIKILEEMKHLKKYNESSNQITEQVINDFFSHTFDLCEKFEIIEAYFNTKNARDYANNDFTGEWATCVEGFEVVINHVFYSVSEISDFEKYVELINQLLEDIKRFTSTYSPKDIFFSETSNNQINLLINP